MTLENTELNKLNIELLNKKFEEDEASAIWTEEDEKTLDLINKKIEALKEIEAIKKRLSEIDTELKEIEIQKLTTETAQIAENKNDTPLTKEPIQKNINTNPAPVVPKKPDNPITTPAINTPKESKKETKIKNKGLKAKLLIGLTILGAGISSILPFSSKQKESKKEDKKLTDNTVVDKNISIPDSEKPTTYQYKDTTTKEKDTSYKPKEPNSNLEGNNTNPRFDLEVFNSLPDQGKEIYKYFAENDPTPGRAYTFLSKDSTALYVFDKENNLIKKIVAGFGKDPGDEKNTAFERNKKNIEGKSTSPAGGYLMSTFAPRGAEAEYGEFLLTLHGKSVLGIEEFLGLHQTYLDELETRTKKLLSPNPTDNNFSNGCINISKEDYIKYIKPFFKGDYGEFLFILQDKIGKQSNVKFNVDDLVKQMIPFMLKMADKQKEIYNRTITRETEIIESLTVEIESLRKEQGRLVEDWKKDTNKNTVKEKRIAKINKEIKNKEAELGYSQKGFNWATKNMEDLSTRERKANQILVNTENPELSNPQPKTSTLMENNMSPEQFVNTEVTKIEEIVANKKYDQILCNPYLAYCLCYSQSFMEEISNSKNQQDVPGEIIGQAAHLITPEFRTQAILFLEKTTKDKERAQGKKISAKEILPLQNFDFGHGESHEDAIDLFTTESSPIYSIQGGIVIIADNNWNPKNELSSSSMKGGNTVVVYNYLTKEFCRYAHLNKVTVTPGELITEGDNLGTVGHTGKNASLPGHGGHLHLEINKYSSEKNINQFLTKNNLKKRLEKLRYIA